MECRPDSQQSQAASPDRRARQDIHQAKENPYSLRSGQIPALADKTARQLSRANAAVYEKTSKVVSNLNASAILIGSLSSMLKEMESARDPPLM